MERQACVSVERSEKKTVSRSVEKIEDATWEVAIRLASLRRKLLSSQTDDCDEVKRKYDSLMDKLMNTEDYLRDIDVALSSIEEAIG